MPEATGGLYISEMNFSRSSVPDARIEKIDGKKEAWIEDRTKDLPRDQDTDPPEHRLAHEVLVGVAPSFWKQERQSARAV